MTVYRIKTSVTRKAMQTFRKSWGTFARIGPCMVIQGAMTLTPTSSGRREAFPSHCFVIAKQTVSGRWWKTGLTLWGLLTF